jgi:hypothetical protein
MPRVRTRLLGNDDVIVEVKRWWLPEWFGDMAFYSYTTLSAARNSVENDIEIAIRKLEDLLDKRQRLVEDLNAEVRDVLGAKHNRYGVGESFTMSKKEFDGWAKPNKTRPDLLPWRSFFHPLICKEYGLTNEALKSGANHLHSNTSRPVKGSPPFESGKVIPSPSGLTTYTLDGKGDLVKGSVDNHVMEFKEPKKNDGGSNSHKEKMKQLRRDNPKESWEDDREYNERIGRLARDSQN